MHRKFGRPKWVLAVQMLKLFVKWPMADLFLARALVMCPSVIEGIKMYSDHNPIQPLNFHIANQDYQEWVLSELDDLHMRV